MSAVLISILAGVAAKVGAPILRKILTNSPVGTVGADIGEEVIKRVAEKLGAKKEDLPAIIAVEPHRVEEAVIEVEKESPDLVLAYVEQQKATNELLMKEIDASESWWTWAWRPAWMWFLMLCWGYSWIFVPLINNFLSTNVAVIPSTDLTWVTTVYSGLYLGGHTIKAVAEKAKEAYR